MPPECIDVETAAGIVRVPRVKVWCYRGSGEATAVEDRLGKQYMRLSSGSFGPRNGPRLADPNTGQEVQARLNYAALSEVSIGEIKKLLAEHAPECSFDSPIFDPSQKWYEIHAD